MILDKILLSSTSYAEHFILNVGEIYYSESGKGKYGYIKDEHGSLTPNICMGGEITQLYNYRYGLVDSRANVEMHWTNDVDVFYIRRDDTNESIKMTRPITNDPYYVGIGGLTKDFIYSWEVGKNIPITISLIPIGNIINRQ